MPAVHSRDRIGMNWKRHVLVHARLLPPDPQRVSVARLVWRNTLLALQTPFRSVLFQLHGRHQLSLALISQFPAAHVMAAGDDSRSNSFSDPSGHDVVADLRFDAH